MKLWVVFVGFVLVLLPNLVWSEARPDADLDPVLLEVDGRVHIYRGDDMISATKGMVLRPGDKVSVQSGSVKLQLVEGNGEVGSVRELNLYPGSLVDPKYRSDSINAPGTLVYRRAEYVATTRQKWIEKFGWPMQAAWKLRDIQLEVDGFVRGVTKDLESYGFSPKVPKSIRSAVSIAQAPAEIVMNGLSCRAYGTDFVGFGDAQANQVYVAVDEGRVACGSGSAETTLHKGDALSVDNGEIAKLSISSDSFQKLTQLANSESVGSGDDNIFGIPSFVTATEPVLLTKNEKSYEVYAVDPDAASTLEPNLQEVDEVSDVVEQDNYQNSPSAESDSIAGLLIDDAYAETEGINFKSLLSDQFYEYDEQDIDGYLSKFCEDKPLPCVISSAQQIASVCTVADPINFQRTKSQICILTDYLSQAEAAQICSEKSDDEFSDCFYEAVEDTRSINAEMKQEIASRYLYLGRENTHGNRDISTGLAFILCEHTDQVSEALIPACTDALEPSFKLQMFNFIADITEDNEVKADDNSAKRWPPGYFPTSDQQCSDATKRSSQQICACQIKTNKRLNEEYYGDCSYF